MPSYDVGIVIPVYNGFRGVSGSTWMLDSIESALHSDHPNFCVTVVDDGSTDGSLPFVHEMLNRDNRGKNIQVIEVNKNVGVGRALNIGIANTNAKYIATQGSDDLCKPERIRLQSDLLNANPDLQMAGCFYWICDENGELTGELTEEYMPTSRENAHLMLISGNCRIGSPMFRKSLWEELGGFDEHELGRCCEDFDFFLRTTERYPLGIEIVPEMLYGYRNSPISLTKEEHNSEYYLALNRSRERRRSQCQQNSAQSHKNLDASSSQAIS